MARDLTVPRDWSKDAYPEPLFSEAVWECLPSQGDRRPARIRLNRQAAVAIGHASHGSHFSGLHIPKASRTFVQDMVYKPAQALYRGREITFATFDKLAALSRDIGQYDRGGDVVLYRADRTRTLAERAADLREELTHWQQHAIGEPSPQVSRAVAAQPAFAVVARALRPTYGKDTGKLVCEVGAKLASGKFADLGVDRKSGLNLLKAYHSALAVRYGTEAAGRILRYTDRRVAHDADIPRNHSDLV